MPLTDNSIQVSAANLREEILENFKRVEQSTNGSKSFLRSLHAPATQSELLKSQRWIANKYPKYSKYFANGSDIHPEKIKPHLIEVDDNLSSDLFRLARLTWSLPFTRGYGRRIKYIVLDESNDKIIGILGLQSPPLDFPARDKLFSYPVHRKTEFVNQTMDIYTLGSIPPYNQLLGGKLIALLIFE